MARVLVTGGAGLIGSHLIDRLVELGHFVTCFDNLSTGKFKNINRGAHFQKVDIRNFDKLEMAAHSHSFDFVFHLAAQINLRDSFKDPNNDVENNILGTLNLIKLVRRHQSKIIFASTGGAIYSPRANIPWSEDDPAFPESPYGISKLAAEHYLRVLTKSGAILRLSNVYGPRQNPKGEAGVIAIFLDKMLNNKPVQVFGDGDQTRDFIYVGDVVDAFICAMENNIHGIYNVSTNDRVSVNRIGDLLQKLTGRTNQKYEYGPAIDGELRHSALNHHKIKAQWGWYPKTSLMDGLRKTVDYYL